MKLLYIAILILFGCDKIKDVINDLEVEDTYPMINRDYQLAARQGNYNSISTSFDVKIPDFLSSKKDEKPKEEPITKITTEDYKNKKDQCNIFSVAVDYISQNYPIKQIDTENKMIITELFKYKNNDTQLTLLALNIDTFKVNSQNAEFANFIKEDIISKCSNHYDGN